jgi:L-alanine-DL-glutamate epimerase-like enolase superfamily enzyme
MGEGALPPYYPFDFKDVRRYVETLEAETLLGMALEDALATLPPGPAPAQAAVDIALHDYWSKQAGQPLYVFFGLSGDRLPVSSVTLSIPDSIDDIAEPLSTLVSFPILKLKLGTGDPDRDVAIVQAVRRACDAQLCVDANGAWTVDEAAAIIPRIAEYDLLFVEQPLDGSDPASWRALKGLLPSNMPPIFADESIQTNADVSALRDVIDGINVKLAKTGGLAGARRLIDLARSYDLRVLLGCMVESSLAVTAAAHLAPLADFADLDGAFLLANDPFEGMIFDRGRLILHDRPGLGVVNSER